MLGEAPETPGTGEDRPHVADGGPLSVADAAADADAGAAPDAAPDGAADASTDADAAAPACETCLVQSCKTQRDACTSDPTCKALSACLDACADSACRSACFAKYPDPAAKAKNGALYKCQCVTSCAAACSVECR